MRSKVIEFLKNLPKSKSEQFNQAFQLYRESPGKSAAAERVYNAAGYSEGNLANLKYDLQKLHGIKDKEIVSVPVKENLQTFSNPLIVILSEMTADGVREWFLNEGKDENYESLIEDAKKMDAFELADVLQEELDKVNSGSDEEEDDNDEENLEVEDSKEVLESVDEPEENPVQDASVVTPIREDYPFLNEKDCPNELKILVADKITAWKIYEDTHAKIQLIESGELNVSEEEKVKLAKTAVNAFEENQAIHEELNAYKETGKVLGKHPIFRTLQLQREVEEMTPEQLIKFKASSAKYFTDNKKAMENAVKAEDVERIKEIDNRVEARKEKLDLVNKKLGV